MRRSAFLSGLRALTFLFLPCTVWGSLHSHLNGRQINPGELREEYDFVVVGGGQSGLVVANRLTENPNVTVLVVEYGYLNDSAAMLEPSSARLFGVGNRYKSTSIPQIGLNNRVIDILSGAVVGGGSAVNNMFLNRGSARNYDDWGRLNNDNPHWTFAGLLPYFQKSVQFQTPSPQLAKEFNITWDLAAYGGEDSPIHVSIAKYQYPGLKPQWAAMEDVGLMRQIEGALGNASGVFWVPSALDNTTVTRSYARTGYFDPFRGRSNLHLLTLSRVNRILFDQNKRATSIQLQPRFSPDEEDVVAVKATKEVILAAGGFHSPQVLHRSGIGPASLLQSANISLVVDLPGVGGNLQDHPLSMSNWQYNKPVLPNAASLTNNATFAAWAESEWKNHRRGPLSIAGTNSAAFLSLDAISPGKWEEIISAYRSQPLGSFLPDSYTPEQIHGYEVQREILVKSMAVNDAAFTEVLFYGDPGFSLVQMKPTSRGTILLNTTHPYADPVLDFRTFVNPIDMRIQKDSFEFLARYHATQTMQETFEPEKTDPDDEAALEAYIRETSRATIGHLSGTCAMMPRDLGGVVDVDLNVYGVTGLRVVDASIQPLIPSSHLCTTVYAVAEKAADLIKACHGML